jgi:hypothetical protein
MAGTAVNPTASKAVRRPWVPAPLAEHGFGEDTVSGLTYMVIDEIVDDGVELILSSWPAADERGRLRFDRLDEDLQAVVALDDLQDHLYARWLERAPRTGDTFAVELVPDARHRLRTEPGLVMMAELLGGSVYDLSAEARKVAKLAHYASVAEILTEREAETWDLVPLEDRDASAAPVRDAPEPEDPAHGVVR